MYLRLKEGVELKELEPFGFKEGIYAHKDVSGMREYLVFVSAINRNIQIRAIDGFIAGSLQCLIYDLTKEGLVYKVED